MGNKNYAHHELDVDFIQKTGNYPPNDTTGEHEITPERLKKASDLALHILDPVKMFEELQKG